MASRSGSGTVPTGSIVRNEAQVISDGADVDPSDNLSFVRGQVGACQRDCATPDDGNAGGSGGGGDAGGGSGGGSGRSGGTAVEGSQLARTGVDTVAASAWACVLLAAGMCLVSTGRRRLALLG